MAGKSSVLKELFGISGEGNVLVHDEDLLCYSYDSTPGYSQVPDYVVRPGSTEEVAQLVWFAGNAGIPVTPRGAGSNLSAGAVPIRKGIVLDMTRMNGVLELDQGNLLARAEAGVITAALHSLVEGKGLFYPPDPGSMSISTLGGNVAENAGGLRGLKYGVTKDYVMGLRVVLANGDVITTGGKTVKNVTGYDLTKLMTGSEGTLGIITEITVKLLPLPKSRKSMLAVFDKMGCAAEAIAGIIAGRTIPATLEIMDNTTLRVVEDFAHVGLPVDAEAVLLIELDGLDEVVADDSQNAMAVCKACKATNVRVAENDLERDGIWAARRTAFSALSRVRPTIILEDATVPRSKIPDMIKAIRELADRHDLMIGTFGHAGDGNLHPSILTDKKDQVEMKRVEAAVEGIFEAAISLGGTLSGEHGIGMAKAGYLEMEMGKAGIGVLRGIKQALDPKGILNPGKFV